jgi:hypothetical protein
MIVWNGFAQPRGGLLFAIPTLDTRRSRFGTGFSWSPLIFWLHRQEKELPVLFTTPHSFRGKCEKSDFNSKQVSLWLYEDFFSSNYQALFVLSSFFIFEE